MPKTPQKPTLASEDIDDIIHYRFKLLIYNLKTVKRLTTEDLASIIGMGRRSFEQYLRATGSTKPTYEKLMKLYNHRWDGIPLGVHGRHFNYVTLFEGGEYTAFETKLQEIVKDLTQKIESDDVIREGLQDEIDRKAIAIHDLKTKVKTLESKLDGMTQNPN